jgi:NAD(P)-dependent dehydrogenase (short-subunit alcohol dehydrogenase family)
MLRSARQALIHNAAATTGSFKLTADNLESQMATNHIGPFLLTKLLAPKILAARTTHYTPRVIFVSALGHAFCDGVNFKTMEHPDPESYEPMNGYFQSKSANVLSAIELSKRSKGQINAYSLHPGSMSRALLDTHRSLIGISWFLFSHFHQHNAEGGRCHLAAEDGWVASFLGGHMNSIWRFNRRSRRGRTAEQRKIHF